MAARALGYAEQSHRQLTALARAARDPDSVVRNNAVRALGILAGTDPVFVRRLASDTFIEMLHSGIWTDPNKGSLLFLVLTKDPLLAALRSKALDSLIEMARWQYLGHAGPARVLLGRIAGIPEDRLAALTQGPVDAILSALPH